MVRLMKVAGTNIKLMLRPRRVGGMKMQMITGLADSDTKIQQMIKRLRGGIKLEWEGQDRLLITGQTDLLKKEQNSRDRSRLDNYWQERKDTDPRKMVLKPLGKSCKGEEQGRKLAALLQKQGVEGVVSVGFSPDKAPTNPNRGVVGFVVFRTVELRDAALDDRELPSYALLGSEFQLNNRVVRSEAKEPERNVALNRKEVALREGLQVQKQAAGNRTGGPTIRDEQGVKLGSGSKPVITGKVLEEAQAEVAVVLRKQVTDLFANLNKQWDEARRAEREERMAEKAEAEAERKRIRSENAELKARIQEIDNERKEQHQQLMQVMQGLSQQLAGQTVMQQTPVREQKPGSVSTPVSIGKPQGKGKEKQRVERVEQGAPATPTKREQAMEAALKLLMVDGDGSGESVRQYLAGHGHKEVAGMFGAECTEHSATV